MNIALAHDWLTSYAGSEQLLFYIHKLFPKAPIYTTVYDQQKIDKDKFLPQQIHTSWLQKIPRASGNHQLLIPLMPLAINWDFSDYDLVISDSSWVMKGLKAKKHIAIILTPTRLLWGFGGDKRADNLLALPLKNLLRQWDKKAALRPDI